MIVKKSGIIEKAEKAGFDVEEINKKIQSALMAKEKGIDFDETMELQHRLIEKQAEKHVLDVQKKDFERISTGISGFDELIEGGIPENSLVLLTGGTGTGKSTFAMQFLINGAKNSEPGLYISLEESAEKNIQQMKMFGWDVEEFEKKSLITIIQPELYDFDKLLELIEESVIKYKTKRLAIDSISLISLYFKDDFKIRRSLLALEEMLKKLKCTTLALSEIKEGSDDISLYGVEEFIVDGIIVMRLKIHQNSYVRTICIRKMRLTSHSLKVCPFQIQKNSGIVVFPDQEVFEEF